MPRRRPPPRPSPATVTSAASISITGSGEFGSVVVGATSDVRTFTVTNATGAPVSGGVTIGAIAGPALRARPATAACWRTTSTPLPLAAGQSCTFDVRFSPQAIGPLTATVSASASPGGAVSVVLNGTGLTTAHCSSRRRATLDAGCQPQPERGRRRPTRASSSPSPTGALAAVTLTTAVAREQRRSGRPADHDDYFGIFTNAGSPCPGRPAGRRGRRARWTSR